MNNTSLPCSLDDTTELRKLILENPDLPLVVFAGEDAWDGECCYTQAGCRCHLDSLTLYNDYYWCDEDDYEERLIDNLADEEEYKDMPDEEFEAMIKERVAETEFVKAIVVYVG